MISIIIFIIINTIIIIISRTNSVHIRGYEPSPMFINC